MEPIKFNDITDSKVTGNPRTSILDTTPTRRNISNSEVTTFLSCRQMYDFAFIRNLAPKKTPKPLARGTLGHLAFQRYAEARIEKATHEQAIKYSLREFEQVMRDGELSIDIILETQFLYERYQSFHNGWPEWEILGTEQAYDLPITDQISIPIRYDIMVREIRTDRKLVGDFKFTYDFWRVTEHQLNGQMPKYISVMNKNGLDIAGGFLEEVRTRPLGKEKSADHKNLWKRTTYYPSIAKKRNMLKQHVATSLEIMEYRNLSDEERESKTIPLLSKHGACKYCNFAELCASKLDGADIDHFIATDFVQNTYGYNQTEELAATDYEGLI